VSDLGFLKFSLQKIERSGVHGIARLLDRFGIPRMRRDLPKISLQKLQN